MLRPVVRGSFIPSSALALVLASLPACGADVYIGGPRADASSCQQPASAMPSAYDQVVLADHPVAYWTLSSTSGTEPDLTCNGNTGTYRGGNPALASLPNGDPVSVFNGANQYLLVPNSPSLSIPTTHNLTWEGWIRPEVLQFSHAASEGYVDWMGKCQNYSPSCEWEARVYSTTNLNGWCNRFSAFVFNPSAGHGSAADWQPVCGLVQAQHWYHVVGEYTTSSQPADCANVSMYPGSINIWVNGVEWDHASHAPTGCLSEYGIAPVANGSSLNIGTMASDTWFQGAIGKVAVYNYLLGPAQIATHYRTMTGQSPTGSCAATCTL